MSDETSTDEASTGEPDPASAGTANGEQELRRARQLVEEGRVEEAVEAYRELVRAHPGQLKARNDLGVLYDEMGAHEMALEEFDAALEIDAENVQVLANRGGALAALGRFEEAERVLKRAKRLKPNSVDVRASLGILHYRKGLYAEAAEKLRWACQRDPENGLAHFYLGEALNRLGHVDEALDALERATHLQPNNARAYYTMGILFDKKHLPEQAAVMYRKSRQSRQLQD